jgi:hypothetical protein
MGKAPRPYFSYLLRLWRVESEGQEVWRASLENPHTGQVMGFDHPKTLFAFLNREMDPRSDVQLPEKNSTT